MDPTDWLPTYPDRPERRRRPLADALASQPPYSSAIFPVPDVLASLTFLPSYPDRVPHLRVPREQLTVTTAAIFAAAVAPTAWLPIFPDRVPHRRTPLGAHLSCVAPPPGQEVVVAQSLRWLPHWPDRVPHRRSLQPTGMAWGGAPLNVLVGGVCGIDFALETFAAPALITQVVVSSGMVAEGLGSPAFIDEDLC